MHWNWFFGLFTSERVVAFATAGYLVVTFVMFWEIRSQGKKSADQLRLVERQIRLQEAALRQWLVIKDWNIRGTHALDDSRFQLHAS